MTVALDNRTTELNDAIALAKAIAGLADKNGVIPGHDPFGAGLDDARRQSELTSDRYETALDFLRADGFLQDQDGKNPSYRLVSVPETPTTSDAVADTVDLDAALTASRDTAPGQRPTHEPPKKKRGRPKGSTKPKGPPTAQVPWKAPKDQAEHMKAIRESRTLKKNARFVAFEAHVQFGLESRKKKVDFGAVKKELTPEYLAMFTGLSESACRSAMAEACRLGFFHRLDNRAGGRGNTNRATYTATVPEWT